MSAKLTTIPVTVLVAFFGSAACAQEITKSTSAAPAARPVEPKRENAENYLPPQYLDPTLMGIKIKTLEDRILAAEETNERLIAAHNELAQKFNTLVEQLKASGPDDAVAAITQK